MIEWISAQPALFWLCLGGLLLITEMLGTAGYLLWSGMAALCVSLITWILPVSWPIQGILFAILTVISAVLWHLWLKRRKLSKEAENLNQKTHQLIGVHAVLLSDTENGFSRVKLADGSWRVYSDTPLVAGDKVTVIAIDGITLQVTTLKQTVSGDDNTLTNDR
ncbi:NfeD family protein [Proteus faecis]|uniref:NfeD family protein n=1 Tax=Proteus faecis TaxID=2050967 RepID=A0AAW7CWS5_9GAMM|nr:NfeD family protein [Proteus faecis]MDL5166347.1 NfeD family protein [Proteus faecis]MDL5274331.1 NfeD family protein [Proteus faecis]MDL5277901.1 NfeD family protein [Proteus faecis]MDL5306891.1 NfeD family protein [Proteus faecis]MDL5310459.1 NfeD family protein [Proteus faecis]